MAVKLFVLGVRCCCELELTVQSWVVDVCVVRQCKLGSLVWAWVLGQDEGAGGCCLWSGATTQVMVMVHKCLSTTPSAALYSPRHHRRTSPRYT